MIEGLGLKVTFRLGLVCCSDKDASWRKGVVSLDSMLDKVADVQFGRAQAIGDTRRLQVVKPLRHQISKTQKQRCKKGT